MCQPSTIPFTQQKASSRPWSPTSREQLIFHWVKFEGHTQSWVAQQLNIDQSTVSRIVDRYQRWIARGGPAYHGSPSHEERIRTQRWLTYERNEWILAAALRIAGEVEHGTEGTRSVISRDMSKPSQETQMRSESKTIDRSAIACRYLRLAHRVNMDQKKLVEEEPLPALEPLTIDDLADDLASPEHRSHHAPREEPLAECHTHPADTDRDDGPHAAGDLSNDPYESIETNQNPSTPLDPPSVHHMHNERDTQAPPTPDPATTSAKNSISKKRPRRAYPVATFPLEGPDYLDPDSPSAMETSQREHRSRDKPGLRSSAMSH
jgi:hypothetical protein